MAENGPIEQLAKIVSSKIFDKFHWKRVGPCDQDFDCVKESDHKPVDKVQHHTHPVDAVFSYKDPYLNKVIYLNTDLKSYKKGSINPRMIEGALTSLYKTIDCARYSEQWKGKYDTEIGQSETRGLLFVFNHDNDFEHDFYEYFEPPKPEDGKRRPPSVNLDKLKVKAGQQVHIIEPRRIHYLMSVIADMNEMIVENTFPRNEYGFFYPQLTYHKVLVDNEYLPATIESLTAPFLIIKHSPVYDFDEAGIKREVHEKGFVIYYNRPGNSELEFMYLLDLLSSYQILDLKNNIRIRVVAKERNSSIVSHFNRALEVFAFEWGFDEAAKKNLHKIKLQVVPTQKEFYSTEVISWDY